MSSESSSSLSVEKSDSTEANERQPTDDTITSPRVEDHGVEIASTREQSDNSDLISEDSESISSSPAGDDGSCGSASGGSKQTESVESPAQIADAIETTTSNRTDDNNFSGGILSFDACNMLMQYSKEFVCLLAIVLTTYATLQNGSPKVSRAPAPVPLFAKNSMVQEWPSGQLNVIQSRVSVSELSFVLFYAPWCAESQFASIAYESVANRYHKEAYFSAVNCWQPGGECRLQYARVLIWPVLMAYFPQGVAVQYSGPWLDQPLTKFIEGLMKPYRRISSRNELEAIRADSNTVLVGFFASEDLKRSEFFMFVQSAIKWLEKDPYQDVQFVVVSGETCKDFNVVETPSIKLYNWNGTKEIGLVGKWSVDNITKWLKDRLNFITTWIHPPGKKSATLAPYLKTGPTIVFFTPKDYYAFNKDAYHMLKQVALEYYRSRNDTQIESASQTFMYSIREENYKKYLSLKSSCANISEPKDEEADTGPFESCTIDEPNITFANILNSSKYDKFIKESNSYCYVEPKTRSCQKIFDKEWRHGFKKNIAEKQSTIKFTTSMLRPEKDKRSALKLLEKSIVDLCKALILSTKTFGDIYFKNDEKTVWSDFAAKANEFNRTLSFILLDSNMYKPIATRLGIQINELPNKSAIIIIDNDNDSTYHMKGNITTKSLMSFVKNFMSGNLPRKLRSTKRAVPVSTENRIAIKEVNSNEFREYLNFSRKTIVVMFYSAQCAMCSLLSQTLLIVAKILEVSEIDFLRIDSDINDLQWQYTMATYPTLIIFPRNRMSESRVFPNSMQINISNVLGFILANLSPEERLQAIYESCQYRRASSSIQNCLHAMRTEISENISRNLYYWRHRHKRRNEILRKLQLLQKVYLTSFRVDTVDKMEIMRKDIIQLKQLREK